MKLLPLFALLLCILSSTFAKEDVDETDFELPIDDDLAQEDLDDLEVDEAILREVEENDVRRDIERENIKAAQIAAAQKLKDENNAQVQIDPCSMIHCSAGRVCHVEGTNASCICIPECPQQSDPRRMVCTNQNQTWNSDCEVHRERCLCESNDSRCKSSDSKHLHINYYGQCKEMPSCSEEEMSDFPRRMRDWLFNVMSDLAQSEELPAKYKNLQTEAETNVTRRWTNAAIWKWCDLDGHPHDRSVSLHELFPIRAPLMSLEHCIAPFLESCDPDNNHRIYLQEWGNCLQLEEGDMEYRCEEIGKTND